MSGGVGVKRVRYPLAGETINHVKDVAPAVHTAPEYDQFHLPTLSTNGKDALRGAYESKYGDRRIISNSGTSHVKSWKVSNGNSKLSILLFLALVVGIISYLMLPSRLFSGGTSIALVIAYMTAVVYGVSSAGSKLYSPKTTWLYSIKSVRSRVWLGDFIRHVSIGVFAIVVGALTYYMFNFDPNGVEYSKLTYFGVATLFVVSPVVIVMLSWISAAKL